jgi:hypothetical protein
VDGGDDFPYSNPETVDTGTACGAEWARRLVPSKRTAAFEITDHGDWADGDAGCLLDPETDAPVTVTATTHELATAIPRRLPASSPLAEIILDQTIWVRTQDGILYPRPSTPTTASAGAIQELARARRRCSSTSCSTTSTHPEPAAPPELPRDWKLSPKLTGPKAPC